MPLQLKATPATFTARGYTCQILDPEAVTRTVHPTKLDEAVTELHAFAATLPDTGWIVTGTWIGTGAPRGFKTADAAKKFEIQRPPTAMAA